MTLDLDLERKLALAYVPAARRAAIETLWRLDVTLGSVLATGSDPMIGRIRLAWWRESLEKLDAQKPPPEPILEAVARDLLPLGVTGTELAEIEEGWEVLLTPEAPTPEELDLYAQARGGRLFAFAARLIGRGAAEIETVGETWALVDLARHTSREDEARAALDVARQRPAPSGSPKPLRPRGMLAMLAHEDAARGLPLAPPGSPGRMLRMLRYHLTGR